jgi:phospholipase/carboxylesterase
MSLTAIQMPAVPSPRGLVVLLHGWGANAQDVVDLIPALDLPGVRFACPNGPMNHPHTPEGRMWYDLESQDWDGLEAGRSQLSAWLDECISTSGVPQEKVILAGFSQGGAMALEVGLARSLAGLVIFSGYLHPHLKNLSRGGITSSPILVLHGEQDSVVPFEAALETQRLLTSLEANLQFQSLEHSSGVYAIDSAAECLRNFSLALDQEPKVAFGTRLQNATA